MANSRSISPETWAHARESLVFYFSRRHSRSDAEDLAQETMLKLWNSEQYVFDKEEDFLKVCYGFARHVAQEAYRSARRHAGEPLEPGFPAPQHDAGSSRTTEARILFEEVCEIGRSKLHDKEWQLIQQAVQGAGTKTKELNLGSANNMRVRLHRVRRKLAKLAGLDETEV